MEQLFWRLADLTLSGSIAILGVLAFRWILKDQAKIFSYLLWIIVGIRLLIPVSFGGLWGLMPFPEIVWGERGMIQDTLGQTDRISPLIGNNAVLSGGVENMVPSSGMENAMPPGSMKNAATPAEILQGVYTEKNYMAFFLMVWAVGVIALAAKNFTAYVKLKKKAQICIKEEEYYLSDDISGAFVLGFLKPRIYLSSRLTAEERRYILSHEKVHLRRKDYLWKGLAECILCVHWFNPLVWIAFRKFTADMEMSCDEAVLRRESRGTRAAYAKVLLAEMAESRKENIVPFFRRGGTERRIHNMMKEKIFSKKRVGICAGVVLAAALLLIPGFWGKETHGKESAQEQSTDSVKVSDKKKASDVEVEAVGEQNVDSVGVSGQEGTPSSEESVEEAFILDENSTVDAKNKIQEKIEKREITYGIPTSSYSYSFVENPTEEQLDDLGKAYMVTYGDVSSDSDKNGITTGGELINVKYNEEESNRLAKKHDCDMVLTADLKVALDGKGHHKTYKDMKWYLSKGKDGEWKIKDADIYHLD